MYCEAETILAGYRRLSARKFDGSKHRPYPGRPPVGPGVEALILRMAQENKSWGYDRIARALANLGHQLSDQTIGNILKRHGIPPAPKRSQSTSWKDFIAAHMAVLAGTDFLTVEVLTWHGLVTYYVLFSFTSRRGASPSPASPDIPPKPGSRKWLAMLSMSLRVRSGDVVTCCMTATPNSASPSRMCSRQRASAASDFRHEVQI